MERIFAAAQLNKTEIMRLLALEDFEPVYREADRIRRENVGDVVHLRAIIEFSNVCKRQCVYCGLNRENKELRRFRMSHEEIIATAAEAVAAGYRTIVLQSGEDDYFTAERLGLLVEDIKKLTLPEIKGVKDDEASRLAANTETHDDPIASRGMPECFAAADSKTPECSNVHPAITLSCGERSEADYSYWREKGADRYLLKHETADPELYDKLHPCGTLAQRVEALRTLKRLGYETGSGFMIGLPGQTLETLADDLLLLRDISCQMAGIGPFISNPKTPLSGAKNGDPEMAKRAVAIARLLLPQANLPLTTSLTVLSTQERDKKSSTMTEWQRTAQQERYGLKNNCGQRNDCEMKKACEVAGRSSDDGRLAAGRRLEADDPFRFGANVIMKKITPDKYKEAYEIYPAKFKSTRIAEDRKELEQLIRGFGKVPL